MVIGLGTLVVFIYQTNLIREQQHMSVFPFLSIGFGYTQEEMSYKIANKGIGPAIITSIKITSKGKEYNDTYSYFSSVVKETGLNIQYSYSNLKVGDLIEEKEKISIFTIKNPDREKTQILMEALRTETTEFEIQYKSIYGEVWAINDSNDTPIKIK